MDQATTATRAMDGRPDGIRTAARSGRNGLLKRTALGALAVAGLAVAAHYGTEYWRVGRFMVDTDDAYVQADNTLIAPRVSGYISQVLVADNQPVKAGQLLARIDDRDYQTALHQAMADRETAEAEMRSIDARLTLQDSTIEEASQQVTAADAALRFAQQEHARYQLLSRSGAGSAQSDQQSQSQLIQRTAGLAQARAALAAARQQVDVLQAARAKAAAQLEHYRAAEQQARLNLGYTELTAPVDGTVGARTLRVGQYVQAGTQLMALVPLNAVYIVANYKETQLTDVRPGQSVDISVDTFPDLRIHGHVDSIAPATGLQFALLPPDNATGNFTKIVQRLPVKIVLDHAAGTPAGLLRPGMSVEPSIDTRTAR
ncbi:MAG TPA: HlyD family secretion protein [Rhodopila sp.]|jgi:membrane fusion protein (multidrug efflux system)|nr:HlyD family secretion protein [Rhodopila sp.]